MTVRPPATLLKRILNLLHSGLVAFRAFLKDRPDPYASEFIAHNRRLWRGYRTDRSRGEILIEANNMGACNVAFTYVASYLGRKENAKLLVYTKGISRANRAFYSSFADSFIYYSAKPYQVRVDALFAKVFPTITSKYDLENLQVDGIAIGDFIYDGFMRVHERPTVDLSSPEFAALLKESLGYLVHWQDYFACHDVKAVLVSHCVYPWNGIIARIAARRAVPVYLAQPNVLYYVTTTHNGRAYNQHIDYPANFARLSAAEQTKAIAEAKAGIARRFRGEKDVGPLHLRNKPSYTPKTGDRLLAESPRLKVLVASHCFSDDNHVYGNNLFPDIYEWLYYVGSISERTDYDWYIKLHPDRFPWETKHIEDFGRRFPRFKVLPADASHHQIIEDGIACVLTVYGSIGFEYAALGVPVITASPWNPTSAYDFNLHPKTVEAYEKLLLNLPGIKLNIDINKVYEYYFCHFLDDADDWLYDSFTRLDAEIGGGRAHIGSLSYRKFLDQFSQDRHLRILGTVDRFVRSKDYALRRIHIGERDVSRNAKEGAGQPDEC